MNIKLGSFVKISYPYKKIKSNFYRKKKKDQMFKKYDVIVRIVSLWFVVVLSIGCSKSRDEVTFSSLLANMTNRLHFAEVPLGTAGMISSYDRTGGNRDWADFSAARDGGRIVLADLK